MYCIESALNQLFTKCGSCCFKRKIVEHRATKIGNAQGITYQKVYFNRVKKKGADFLADYLKDFVEIHIGW